MCLDDKDIIASIEYSEQAKEYRDNLKTEEHLDIQKMVVEMANKHYQDGCEDMKLRIENMLLQSIIDLKEHPVLKEDLNEFKIGVIQSIFRIIKEMK